MKNVNIYSSGITDLEQYDDCIQGSFWCYDNQLTSLVGAPKEYVGGDFYCHCNQLTSLEGAPKVVNGNFNCSVNELTSLEGAPKYVGGNFYCDFQRNGKKFTVAEVRKVCHVIGDVYI